MKTTRGFTLIEVLITLIILMFGMLGIAGLMGRATQVSFESFQRHAALQIANEMAERLRGNRALAENYRAAALAPDGVGPGGEYAALLADTCMTTPCTPAQLVTYDIGLWVGSLQGQGETSGGNAVGGVINARGCIERGNEAPPPPPPAIVPAGSYRVSVAYQGRDDLGAGVQFTSTCGTGLYGTDGRRRVVSVDVQVQ